MSKTKTKLQVADLEAWQEFRIGGTWYRALLPPLCRFANPNVNWCCLNLETIKEVLLRASRMVDELR
jgi:hypothetical protein